MDTRDMAMTAAYLYTGAETIKPLAGIKAGPPATVGAWTEMSSCQVAIDTTRQSK